MNIGIDKIGCNSTIYAEYGRLSQSRDVDPDKYSKGLLLSNLSITPVNDDIVTLGASAAKVSLATKIKKTLIWSL